MRRREARGDLLVVVMGWMELRRAPRRVVMASMRSRMMSVACCCAVYARDISLSAMQRWRMQERPLCA